MKRVVATVLAVVLAISGLSAQNMRTGYFMDGYAFNFKMNPAIGSSRGFFSIPVLGNTNAGVSTNLALSSILYPKSDGSGLTLFLNSEVPAEFALSKFKPINKLNVNTDLSLIAFGFWTGSSFRMFHNFEVSLKADVNASLPYDLFRFAKEGTVNGDMFRLDNLAVSANTYLSVAYGFNIPIGKHVRLGARVKALFGLASAELDLTGTRLQAASDKWTISTAGKLMMALPAKAELPVDEDGNYNFAGLGESFSNPDLLSNISSTFGSAGAAVDLGVTVDFLENFTASVSVTDLGFISWNNCYLGEGLKDASGQPVEYVVVDNTATTDFSQLGEKLQNCIKIHSTEYGVKKTTMLSPMLYAGLQYRMPFYERLSVGALSSTKFSGKSATWTEGRFCINLDPVNWFSISTNYAYSTFGHSAGAALSFHLPGLNLFVGTDSYIPLTNVTPQWVPVNAVTTSVTVGLNIMFGRYSGRYSNND